MLKTMHSEVVESKSKERCELCKLADDCPNKYGEKITLENHNLTVHYFCLLMASGVYQRGEEDEGIYGFLVEDIKQEIRRSSRLTCNACKKKGASVGCNIKSCRKVVHLPCGIQQEFIFQFTGQFPSFCKDHRPVQIQPLSSYTSNPLCCSVCLESVEPVLSYTVLKCPCCHSGWFHRDCLQRQANSAAMFFFRCTICNNKDKFQQEMLRMGIHIPERDASWELEENAYGELLQVYQHCDALKCRCDNGRGYSANDGKWVIIRCKFCGSRGTHRLCSSLKPFQRDWICSDCRPVVNKNGVVCQHIKSPTSGEQEKKRLLKRQQSSLHSAIICKKSSFQMNSPQEILHCLSKKISPLNFTLVEIKKDGVLKAAQQILRQNDFDPHHTMTVTFPGDKLHSEDVGSGNLRRFLRLLVQDLQNLSVFQGPENKKNLALDSQALRDDLYFDAGCTLALSLVHGGPPPRFFSRALYKCLFNFPSDSPLTVRDMVDNVLAEKVKKIRDARSLKELKEAVSSSTEYLKVAGCLRQMNCLSDKQQLVDDIVTFHFITRMQLPLQRFREGLNTLGLFEQIQMFPGPFCDLFCSSPEKMSAGTMDSLFSVQFSVNEEKKKKERTVVGFWRQYLHECEEGRCATTLEDILIFSTSADAVPAVGFNPAPSLSFLHPQISVGVFPERHPSCNHIVLPVLTSYEIFKKHMEYAVCQLTMMQTL
ncbi:G2/M phase-specific E3 ubiquitin-protein ligase isoform X1 [Paramormyrops kingsleyae]|uniref:G2/M-phase specific E3 ubiquitin protein ligase n=2 Tax=Paramormyrops kingsleyae TaxID=1676925 RepID=A0A3B3Q2N1_9TELE|nr:G2/M phase-specific E3 ubiquitin-protein ligase isoform X1 [Paramormyrops kingsleyae]